MINITSIVLLQASWLIFAPPPLLVQEPETDDIGPGPGPGPGEVSSWDVNTERMTSTVGKLCKTESQNHMSPRYTADHYIYEHAHKTVLCHHVFTQVALDLYLFFMCHLEWVFPQQFLWNISLIRFLLVCFSCILSFLCLASSSVKWRTGCRGVLAAPPWKTDRTLRPRATGPAAWRASAPQTHDS